jgi:hypothetical protein
MGLHPDIRYVGLDFDGCICDAKSSFWTFIEIIKDFQNKEYPFGKEIYTQWIRILARETIEGKCSLIRPQMIEFLKKISQNTPFLEQPMLFVYTNNQSFEIVETLANILREILGGCAPWYEVFHPQDPCREDESGIDISAKLKSYRGILQCLEFPEDLSYHSLLFLDDQEHPLSNEIGSRYIQVPTYKSHDTLIYYLRTLTLAMFTVVKEQEGRKMFFEIVGGFLGANHIQENLVSDEQIREFLRDCEETDQACPKNIQPFHDTLLQQIEPFLDTNQCRR